MITWYRPIVATIAETVETLAATTSTISDISAACAIRWTPEIIAEIAAAAIPKTKRWAIRNRDWLLYWFSSEFYSEKQFTLTVHRVDDRDCSHAICSANDADEWAAHENETLIDSYLTVMAATESVLILLISEYIIIASNTNRSNRNREGKKTHFFHLFLWLCRHRLWFRSTLCHSYVFRRPYWWPINPLASRTTQCVWQRWI